MWHDSTSMIGKIDTLKDCLASNEEEYQIFADIIEDVLEIHRQRFDKIWEAAKQGKEDIELK